eukprot:gene25932-34530_t
MPTATLTPLFWPSFVPSTAPTCIITPSVNPTVSQSAAPTVTATTLPSSKVSTRPTDHHETFVSINSPTGHRRAIYKTFRLAIISSTGHLYSIHETCLAPTGNPMKPTSQLSIRPVTITPSKKSSSIPHLPDRKPSL